MDERRKVQPIHIAVLLVITNAPSKKQGIGITGSTVSPPSLRYLALEEICRISVTPLRPLTAG